MDGQWNLDTHGDPLGKVRNFIKVVWLKSDLDGMLVTLDGGDITHSMPSYITKVAAIDGINPFRPLMAVNTARLIPGILADQPHARIGALLRPCELRALTEMAKHAQIDMDRLLTISVDCLGTLPADEYQWRRERLEKNISFNTQEGSDELAREALKFARQGGIIPYRYRSACQVCSSPAAENADINLLVLGLPVRRAIVVSIKDPKTTETLSLDGYANGIADDSLILQRERILSRMGERHTRLVQRLEEDLASLLPADVDAFIRQLEACGDCQACMQACPICSVDQPKRDTGGHYDRQGITRWLVSCAGCGMCEQACPKTLPTSTIFAHIRRQLDLQWDYFPGRSLADPLPLI